MGVSHAGVQWQCHDFAANELPQPQAVSLLGLSLTTKEARMSSSL